jgi:hypothetical protein
LRRSDRYPRRSYSHRISGKIARLCQTALDRGPLHQLKHPAAPKFGSRTPYSAARRPPAATPGLTFGSSFVTLRQWKRPFSASDSWPTARRAQSDFLTLVMPKVRIHNRTKVAGTALPNGVELKITVGNATKPNLTVGGTATYDISLNQVIRIEPTNTMIEKANWRSDGKEQNLYIIPADQAFGVVISYNDPDA